MAELLNKGETAQFDGKSGRRILAPDGKVIKYTGDLVYGSKELEDSGSDTLDSSLKESDYILRDGEKIPIMDNIDYSVLMNEININQVEFIKRKIRNKLNKIGKGDEMIVEFYFPKTKEFRKIYMIEDDFGTEYLEKN